LQLILRRRTFLINLKLQFSILLTSLCHIGLLIAVVTVALFAPLILELNSGKPGSADTSDAARRILYLHDVYWLPVLLSLLAIGLHSVRSSHRIAGPVYRFRRVCEAMAGGVVPEAVTLRKGDQLHAEMDVVNAMLETWRLVVADAKENAERLQESLAAYEELSDTTPGSPDAAAAWADILRSNRRLHDTLARVAVGAPPAAPAGEPAAARRLRP
jgi:hypothetical protein